MKRFYTLPDVPLNVWNNYPYALTPFHKVKRLQKYPFKHAIVDCGVEIFFKGAKEYPQAFLKRYEYWAYQYTCLFREKIWFVIPDYPDDYRNNPIPHNVRRTLTNIRRYHSVEGVNWVYPIQSDYLNLQSLHDSCHEVMKFQPKRVAIGTVCKIRNVEYIEKCCRMVRQHFYTEHIHAFGPTLTALPRILPYIDSWDSCAYFTSHKSGMGMCRNQKERAQYFRDYLSRVNEILKDFNCQMRF